MALNRDVIECQLHGINHGVCHTHQGSHKSVIKLAPVHQKGGIASEVELDIHEGVWVSAIIQVEPTDVLHVYTEPIRNNGQIVDLLHHSIIVFNL